MTDYSTDYSQYGGGYDSGFDTDKSGVDAAWQEFWDEAAQAKYWYNHETGEASWTKPTGGGGSVPPSARSAPASARDNPQDWVSYIDEDTGQEYWYNTKTGETSWA